MGEGILGLDESRSRCAALADHYDAFAERMRGEYPSLAGPSARLSELFRELQAALGRISASTEELVVTSDRLAARLTG